MSTQKDETLSNSCTFDLIIEAICNQRTALDELMCVEREKMFTAYSHSRDNNTSVKHSVESINGIILLYQQTLDQSLNTVCRLKNTLCSDTHYPDTFDSYKDEDYYLNILYSYKDEDDYPHTSRSRKNEDYYSHTTHSRKREAYDHKTSHPNKYEDYYGRYWANRP